MNYKNELLAVAGLALVVLLLGGCAISTPIPTATLTQSIASAVPTVAATALPTEFSSLNPSPRGYFSMAYDSKADQVILFGGLTGNEGLPSSCNGETWAYNVAANRWTQMKPPSGPTVRDSTEMAYDSKADRVILFGGALEYGKVVVLADTWAYDFNTNTWTEMANGPANYGFGSIVYDAQADRIILYGGSDATYVGFSPDTWAYNYNTNTWTDMKPSISPPARNTQVLVYDTKANRVIMWGGDTGWEERIALRDENVWSYDYDTNTWQEIKPPQGTEVWPDTRDWASAAYDSKSDRMIMSGGYYQAGTDETWAYDYNTNTWTKLEPNKAGGMLSASAMVYSSAADRFILFGGLVGNSADTDYTGETWSYDFNTNTWTDVTPHN